jgi:patatin-related protein
MIVRCSKEYCGRRKVAFRAEERSYAGRMRLDCDVLAVHHSIMSTAQATDPIDTIDTINNIDSIEHRLAVVMNGGVSLAVWMGGVSRELDSLRRASSGLAGPDSEASEQGDAERKLFELWQQHSTQRNVRFTIDVVAGTSAGGLNGVLLATAVAHGAQLSGLRKLWMDAAQLSTTQLLKPQEGGSASVLNGGYFLDQISNAVTNLELSGIASEGADIALTVTATALRGRARMVQDRTGALFSEPDHRRR